MKNILSFEDLFPSYKRPKHFLEESCLSKYDIEINDIIYESFGVSLKVINIVNDLINQIKDCIENKEFEKIGNIEDDLLIYNQIKSDNYYISQIFNIGDFLFDTDLIIMNYSGISAEKFEELSTLNVLSRINFISQNRFKLLCYIPTLDFNFNKIGIRVLNHEVMHAWQHHNKNTNKKEKEYPEWRQLYQISSDIIINKDTENTDNLIIAKGIYSADLRELAAFTQQAYQDLKHCQSLKDADRKIKKTDIHNHMIEIYNAIKYIEQNGIPDDFKSPISEKMLINILKKRYNQYKKNIARLVVARKEIIEENMDYMGVSKKELMLIGII